jgi:hypothetical protein
VGERTLLSDYEVYLSQVCESDSLLHGIDWRRVERPELEPLETYPGTDLKIWRIAELKLHSGQRRALSTE